MLPSRHLAPVPIRGPRTLPLLGPKGNVLRFFRDPVGAMLRMHREYGRVAALSDGDPTLICAFGADFNRQVLSDQNLFHNNEEMLFRVPADSPVMRLERSLPLMNGATHRRQRRMMMPAFHRTAIEVHRDDIVAIAERYLARWPVGRTFDVAEELHELTLAIALKCFFGLEASGELDVLGRLGTQHLHGLTSVGTMIFPYDLPGTPYRRFLRVSDRLEARILALIQEKRSRPEAQHDAFSMLLRAHDEDGSTLTNDELIGQANVLFLAGHETTSYSLTWTIFLLSQHPELLSDLRDELSAGLHGDAPTVQQVGQLGLLDRVVKESMRVLPAVPMLFIRYATEDCSLGDVPLPKGTGVILSPLVCQRMPDLFPEPERFLPERWVGLQPSIYEYLPFGAGPRMCIGASFATLALRILLAMIVQRHPLALAPGARISRVVRGITLGPRYGMPMISVPPDRKIEPATSLRGDIHELVRLS